MSSIRQSWPLAIMVDVGVKELTDVGVVGIITVEIAWFSERMAENALIVVTMTIIKPQSRNRHLVIG